MPRTAFGLNKGLKTEFFATPDWTGRPVAVGTEPAVQTDWENAKPAPEVDTINYSVRWSGTITAPAAGHYVFTLEPGDSFPYSPTESYRLLLDGKVVSRGFAARPVRPLDDWLDALARQEPPRAHRPPLRR